MSRSILFFALFTISSFAYAGEPPVLEIFLKDAKTVGAMFADHQHQQLDMLADYLREHHLQEIQLEGHVYSSGDVEKDLRHGDEVVNFARRYLESHGVNSHQITVISMGAEKPVVEPATKKSNSRIEVEYLCHENCFGVRGDVID